MPSVLASFPLACSKKMPYPPRMAVFPCPVGSQAKPTRGAGLNRCPVEQPTAETDPTAALGNPANETGPPGAPQSTRPRNGLPTPGSSAPAFPVIDPSPSNWGAFAIPALYTVGSQL